MVCELSKMGHIQFQPFLYLGQLRTIQYISQSWPLRAEHNSSELGPEGRSAEQPSISPSPLFSPLQFTARVSQGSSMAPYIFEHQYIRCLPKEHRLVHPHNSLLFIDLVTFWILHLQQCNSTVLFSVGYGTSILILLPYNSV